MLFDEQAPRGRGLPPALQAIYGDRQLLEPVDRPYVYANFVISHDGRVSCSLPGALRGGAVSLGNRHDQWLMGLLRARADAVLLGDVTLRLEPDHVWTAAGIFPQDASTFDRLRQVDGRTPAPLQVFASLHGDIPAEAAVFQQPGLRVVIAGDTSGIAQARARLTRYAGVDYLDLGAESTSGS